MVQFATLANRRDSDAPHNMANGVAGNRKEGVENTEQTNYSDH